MKRNKGQEQLERTIRCMHSKSDQYKTILITSPHLYLVVTRVNYLTAKLWIEWRNSVVKEDKQNPESPLRRTISWLTMNKHYRREETNRILGSTGIDNKGNENISK